MKTQTFSEESAMQALTRYTQNRLTACLLLFSMGLLIVSSGDGRAFADKQSASSKPAVAQKPKSAWRPLFDGKSLKGWSITEFGGEGDVTVKDRKMILELGSDMTGVTAKQKLPKINYEVKLDAQRVQGSDFFCGLTFPVGKEPCSLIIGGWGGGVCGLSSIDQLDASENETTTYREFKNGKWYRIRLRVTDERIQAWIDGEELLDQDTRDHKLSIRIEVELSKPFGFSTWQTTAALRNIHIRELNEIELRQSRKKQEDE